MHLFYDYVTDAFNFHNITAIQHNKTEVSLTYVGLHTGPPSFSTNPISVKPREVPLLTLVALDWSNGPSNVT